METVEMSTRSTGQPGYWRVENVEGALLGISNRGRRHKYKFINLGKGLIKASLFTSCVFRDTKNKLISCTYLPDRSIQIGIHDVQGALIQSFVIALGEECTIIENHHPVEYKKSLISRKAQSCALQGEVLSMVKQMSAPRPKVNYLFTTKKVKPTDIPRVSTPYRSVTLYNNGVHLYVKLKTGDLLQLMYRYTHHGAWCTTITGCDFLEKGIILKHLGHTLGQDAIVTFIDQLHNWHLTVVVKKNQMIGVDDLSHSIGVAQVTE